MLATVLFFKVGLGPSPTASYTWTRTVHLHDHRDGSVSATPPTPASAPFPTDLAASLRITLTSTDIGQWMTLGRSFSAKEETTELSKNRSAIYTPTLRPLIAEVISTPIPPDSASTLTPDAQSAYLEALSLYKSNTQTRTFTRPPPLREWMRLAAVFLILAAVTSVLFSFSRARLYRSRGRERLALDQCPHCGHAMTLTDDPRCPACGADHIQWAITMNVDPSRAIANSEGPPPPAMPNLPPPAQPPPP